MSGMTKAERLKEMTRLYIQRAFSDVEMAQKLGVDRTIIFRDRRELSREYPIEKDEEGRYHIPKSKLISEIKVSLHEALTLYLAARKTSRQTPFHHPHAANAVEKLAAVLRQPMAERLLKTADHLLAQKRDSEKIKILETITQAWVEQRKVRIEYQRLGHEGVTRHTISPYLIEPSIWSDSVYVIAQSDFDDKTYAFKIERILHAFLTGETFEIPASFDDERLLKHAWGIWYADRPPVMVKLRFAPNPGIIQRLEESVWHPLQNIEPTEDGGRIWSVEIAEWREMLPWIRGWGADCEVLEPEELRKALEKEVKRMAKVYGAGEIKPEDDLIAHVRKDGKEQSLIIHLTESSQLAERFAKKVDLPEIGKMMGLLHDFGKASKEFQEYLRSATGRTNPDEDEYVDYEAKKGKIDHSTAGAQLIFEKLASRGQEGKILAQFLALAIASHHSGLIDCLTPSGDNKFGERIKKEDEKTHLAEARGKLPDIERQLDEILARPIEQRFVEKLKRMREPNDSSATLPFKHGLLARFLLSCLLEADRLNTADFEHPENEVSRNYGKYVPWDTLIERLETRYAEYAQKTAQMQPGRALEVNQLRAQVAQACLEAATKPKGIYQLTVPTGGGKTEASLRFALHHARAHGMERVFYIVPYITIIDQNADKLRKILEKEDERGKVVLEHHSNFVPAEDTRKRHNLLAENWDAPIVFTTQVQFLEALFGYGTRDARRMHQMANSVIIFDEVQTIPIRITHMFTAALRFLTHDCGATVVLCTATQPPLDKLPSEYRKLTIEPEYKIIKDEPALFKQLKRVEVHDERKPGGLTNAEIADLAERALEEKGSVLIVVNTRASAKALYEKIKERQLGAAVYHLSTNMCPAHRMDKLDEIRDKLKKKEPVICVSTQLIEAGVDIDFDAVIRSLAGLDSIAQAAGRCNREGMREDGGSVWVVNPQEENLDQLKDIQIGREHAQRVLDDFRDTPNGFGNDRIGLDAVRAYYNFYYQSQQDQMNYPVGANSSVGRNDDLFNLLSVNELSTKAYKAAHQDAPPDILLRQSFRTANGEFRVIDSPTRGVIVPYKEGGQIITELCGAFGLEKKGKLLKQAQRYSVNLFDHQLNQLLQVGAIQEVQEAGIYYLNEQYYSDEFGWSDEPVTDMKVHIE